MVAVVRVDDIHSGFYSGWLPSLGFLPSSGSYPLEVCRLLLSWFFIVGSFNVRGVFIIRRGGDEFVQGWVDMCGIILLSTKKTAKY